MFESRKEAAESRPCRAGLAAAIAVAAFVLIPAAHAADKAPGMRVYKDPETGELRAPTPEEAAALDAAAASSKSTKSSRATSRGMVSGRANPGPVTYADGTVEQELDESSMSYTVMKRNADGSTELVCVTGSEAANAALKDKRSLVKVAKASKEHNHDLK